MTGRTEGKVALVTGAARGQGRSHAVRLAEEGADIIAVDICEDIPGLPYPGGSEAELAETVARVEALGRRIFASKVDVRDFAALKVAVDRGVDELGRLDIVSASAGIGANPCQVHEISADVWQDMLDINLTGVWHTCKVAVPHLIAGGRGGSIVLTSSVAGLHAVENVGHYVAAKHAVVGLMRNLALELGQYSIRVNTLHPTQTQTPMLVNEANRRLFVPDTAEPTMEQFAAASQAMHALPVPWVESVDISNALLFLCSDEGRYVTGATLPIDAGCLLR